MAEPSVTKGVAGVLTLPLGSEIRVQLPSALPAGSKVPVLLKPVPYNVKGAATAKPFAINKQVPIQIILRILKKAPFELRPRSSGRNADFLPTVKLKYDTNVNCLPPQR